MYSQWKRESRSVSTVSFSCVCMLCIPPSTCLIRCCPSWILLYMLYKVCNQVGQYCRRLWERADCRLSYSRFVCDSVQGVQSPAEHQSADAEWGWLAAACGLGRVTELLLMVSGVTVRPQDWGILIIYLIVRMCWLINLSRICRINYPIIPL